MSAQCFYEAGEVVVASSEIVARRIVSVGQVAQGRRREAEGGGGKAAAWSVWSVL